ncbi:hypothetical protein E2320_004398 [Naja naja]|nr:hypothetical protein E2320_004398 [Naja naja]
MDCPNLDFEYGDADGHAAELAELYSYTEGAEFALNRKCFEEDFQLQATKVKKREDLGLPPLPEDSIQVMRNMRAASPPTYTAELGEQPQPPAQKRGHRSRRPLMKQDSLDIYNERDPFKNEEAGGKRNPDDLESGLESELDLLERGAVVQAEPLPCPPVEKPLMKQDSLDIYNERDPFKNEEAVGDEEEPDDLESGLESELDLLERGAVVQAEPLPCPPVEKVSFPKGLPWAPKVRQKDIEHFLETSRNKFIGFTLGQ